MKALAVMVLLFAYSSVSHAQFREGRFVTTGSISFSNFDNENEYNGFITDTVGNTFSSYVVWRIHGD